MACISRLFHSLFSGFRLQIPDSHATLGCSLSILCTIVVPLLPMPTINIGFLTSICTSTLSSQRRFYEVHLPRTVFMPPHNPLVLTTSSSRAASSGMQILRSLKSVVLSVLNPRSRVKAHLYPAFSTSRNSRSEYSPLG